MYYYTYLLKSVSPGMKKTYVGYSHNVNKRLILHNSNKGAKSTRGYKWVVIYKKRFKTKNEAMSYEYMLKNNKLLRKKIFEMSNR
jgi:putative endonuclease